MARPRHDPKKFEEEVYAKDPLDSVLTEFSKHTDAWIIFKTKYIYRVIEALERAKFTGDKRLLEKFKSQRKVVLGFQEPQYQRIVTVGARFVDFDKQQKRPSNILGSNEVLGVGKVAHRDPSTVPMKSLR